MKKMNIIKSSILSIVGTVLLSASFVNAGDGYNVLFDSNNNGDQPLNYNNSGCLIYNANEQMGRASIASYAFGAGTFYATGDERACAKVCAGWKTSFTKDPGPYNWESNHMYVYPKGFPIYYYIPTNINTAHFVCKTNYSPRYTYANNCFQPNLAPEPNPKKTPYVFVTHDSDYAYCDLQRSFFF